MKFLLDACAASRSLQATLIDLGHDVLSVPDAAPRSTDAEVLALALAEQRVLITEDKDFGELVFVRRLPHPAIVRFTDMSLAEKAAAMRDLLEHHEEAMREGRMIVVTRNRMRIRRGDRD